MSTLLVLSGCKNTEVSNKEDDIYKDTYDPNKDTSADKPIEYNPNEDTVGGPVKYDSNGTPVYNEYDSKFEKEWKSKDGNIKFILNNKAGLDGRGRYQGTYIYKDKSYKVEFLMESDYLLIDADNIAYNNDDNTFILSGTYTKNDKNNEITLRVEEIYDGIKTKTNDIINSIYNVGDEIIFNQVSD